jgi:transposase
MSVQRFVSGSREQAFLLPPDMREWLPDDHLAWVVVEAVGRLDLSALRGAYRDDGNGRPAYDPALMVALLLYAYATGERSSRVIERRCLEDVAMRVICAGVCPDHATIARFRRRHAEALIGLFGQVLALCRLAGLGRLGTIAIDGTKVRANASKQRYVVEEQAAGILAEAEARDAAEDELGREEQGALRGSGGLGDASERRARFEQAAETLAVAAAAESSADSGKRSNRAKGRRLAAARKRGPNLTDPESRVMKSGQVWVQGYNAQVAVSDDHLVVACEISTDNVDHALLEPMIDAVRAQLGPDEDDTPVEFVADAGYWKGEAIERLHNRGEKVLVPPNGRPRTRGLGGSTVVSTMSEQLAEPETAKRYRRRQALVEPVIAHIKCNRRLDRFLLRGTAGARLEWTLGCTAHNLTRLARLPQAA